MKLVTKIKLSPTDEQKKYLLETIELYNIVSNRISDLAFKEKKRNKFDIHHLCYRQIRNEYPKISSQMVVLCIGEVSAQMKRELKNHKFKKHESIRYDSRVFSFTKDEKINIWTINGREKIELIKTKYHIKILSTKPKSMILSFEDGDFYVNLVHEKEEKKQKFFKNVIGVDMGIKNIATLSDGTIYSGSIIEICRKKYSNLRKSLQKKGTKSAKRKLKKIRKKESRFIKNVNHVISKSIVTKAEGTQSAISVENLTDIRKSKTVNKSQRKKLHSWAFYQLREFIKYKAKIKGISVFVVDPKYTSQKCRKCGNISRCNRKSQSEFLCVKCGHKENADINAAYNIASRAVTNLSYINQPNVTY